VVTDEMLWLRLQSNLVNFHKTLIEIIEKQAWEQGGSFTDAWDAKMGNLSFAPKLRNEIIEYATDMLDARDDDEEGGE
jgi:hypothetical protein